VLAVAEFPEQLAAVPEIDPEIALETDSPESDNVLDHAGRPAETIKA
jgi:predicted TIM-barrel fold metal-dependent hydrolase